MPPKKAAGRPKRETLKRIPAGTPRLKLTVNGIPQDQQGYWAKPEQFEELKDAGYSFVYKDNVEIGSEKTEGVSLGSIVSQSAGSDGSRLYLMKIPKQWYKENQAVKQKAITAVENQIKSPSGDNVYVPDGGISMTNEFVK